MITINTASGNCGKVQKLRSVLESLDIGLCVSIVSSLFHFGSPSVYIDDKLVSSVDLALELNEIGVLRTVLERQMCRPSIQQAFEVCCGKSAQTFIVDGNAVASVLPSFQVIRNDIIGIDALFPSPFGSRKLLYADYTASGRSLYTIESYLMYLMRIYANAHTEDDVTGRAVNSFLHCADSMVLQSVHAPADKYEILMIGTGSTGAIYRLQCILGISVPPATRQRINQSLLANDGRSDACPECESPPSSSCCSKSCEPSFSHHHHDISQSMINDLPIVFIGPYEHHSNEISWREGLCIVKSVPLTTSGVLDLVWLNDELTKLDAHPKPGRLIIGSFSACSNVTGLISPVSALCAIMHSHGGLIFFDYSASAPYVDIHMCHNADDYIDCIFFSPHKFLGGPSSSGVLIFKKELYHTNLPPSVSGGGTVDFVTPHNHKFSSRIATRENAGTPGVLQNLRTGLVCQFKQLLGIDNIEIAERKAIKTAFDRWSRNPIIRILGIQDPDQRIPIVAFNLIQANNSHGYSVDLSSRSESVKFIHPKLVTTLLNDLFGIQSRAGCSCAGPYGHYLLSISQEKSEAYQDAICNNWGLLKPGWCRVGFHYTMDELDIEYIIRSIEFLAENAGYFLPLYNANMTEAFWEFCPWFGILEEAGCPMGDYDNMASYAKRFGTLHMIQLLTEGHLLDNSPKPMSVEGRQVLYKEYMDFAEKLVDLLKKHHRNDRFHYLSLSDPKYDELRFYNFVTGNVSNTHDSHMNGRRKSDSITSNCLACNLATQISQTTTKTTTSSWGWFGKI